ncbi:MAG: UDP-N-acetylmuramate--L-alanine ligase [Actinomycetia bacterium]|nr:UDP-N-acetylmuramate--L-alanine ligase [Actinomycetes bacterium]
MSPERSVSEPSAGPPALDVMPPLDSGEPLAVHIVAIGGAGMSAIATVLARMGHTVTGSDLKGSRNIERLRALGVRANVGHSAANLPADLDAVVISTAVPASNVEVVAARERGVPVLRRAEALRALVATRRGIAVAGSHGKTTTSSMLALILRGAGLRPSFVIGGELNEVGTNAAYDAGEWFVVEADESDGTFLELAPVAAIVTNVEADHLETYRDFAGLVVAFRTFLAAVPGPRVVCADDAIALELASEVGALTYGEHPDADYRIGGFTGSRLGSTWTVHHHGVQLDLALPVAGLHNALNATGAAAIALELGVAPDAIAAALASFGGVARRFEARGTARGVAYIDDYAHLPGEVKAAIRAARDGGWERVVVVFQPHRYSRTAALWRDFGDAFAEADLLVLTDIYAAGEVPRPGVSGRLVLRAVLEAHPSSRVVYLPHRHELVSMVPGLTRAGDLVLTLGAGDLTTLPDEWLGAAEVAS